MKRDVKGGVILMNKKYSTILLSILITAGSVFALWLLGTGITGYSIYKVSSTKPDLSINTQLLGADLDTTNESKTFTDTLKVLSTTKNNASVIFEFIKADDESDDCYNYENDCDVYLYYEDGIGYGFDEPLTSGDIVPLSNGINEFKINGSCERYACPQNITAIVNVSLIQA